MQEVDAREELNINLTHNSHHTEVGLWFDAYVANKGGDSRSEQNDHFCDILSAYHLPIGVKFTRTSTKFIAFQIMWKINNSGIMGCFEKALAEDNS